MYRLVPPAFYASIDTYSIQAFPIVFQEEKGWSPGIGGLAFIPIGIGMAVAVCLVFYFNKLYVKRANKEGGIAPPEARLPMAMLGGVLLPIGVSFAFVIIAIVCSSFDLISFSGLRK